MDADEAEERTASEIDPLSPAVKRVQVPELKDMNDFYLRAGKQAIAAWLGKQRVGVLVGWTIPSLIAK